MKIAIVAEWLKTYAGSERVLEEIITCYPEADLFAIVDFVPDEERGFLQGKKPIVSFIQGLPLASRYFRHYLPLMPLAIEQLDLSAYDVIISNNHAVAKGVITGPHQLHVSYVHSPMRYAWDLQHQYLRESGLDRGLRSWITRGLLQSLRQWDQLTSNRVDLFLTNSRFIEKRIWRCYRRGAEVIPPPVDTQGFTLHKEKEDFYFSASRLVPYKRMDVIVEAFSKMPEKRLIVIGDGPEFQKIEKKAGANVTLLGYQPFDVLKDHLQRARAFIFAAEEDFGILPVEAQACGTPVIAFGQGGALETVKPLGGDAPPTGLFFEEQNAASIKAAIERFEAEEHLFSPKICREHALQYGADVFRDRFKARVDQAINEWSRDLPFQKTLKPL